MNKKRLISEWNDDDKNSNNSDWIETENRVRNAVLNVSFFENEANLDFYIDDEITNYIKEKYDLKADANLTLQSISSGKKIHTKGRKISLSDMKPNSVIKEGATYIFNGNKKKIPSVDVFEKELIRESIIATKGSHGELDNVLIFNKEDGSIAEIVQASPNLYVTIENDQIDFDAINEKFSYGEKHHDESKKGKMVSIISDLLSSQFSSFQRSFSQQNTTCNTFKVIELALAYDSSFCSGMGGAEDASFNEIIRIVSVASLKYNQAGLCASIVITHLEGYCDPNKDPYKKFVDTQISGCAGTCNDYGLLDQFQEFWTSDREDVIRDTAHLFIGTPLDCDSSCLVGCAYSNVVCRKFGYGVEHLTYTDSIDIRATLFAHELGHNAGASHTSTSYIMNKYIENASRGFSEQSISLMINEFERGGCIGECVAELCCVSSTECDNGLFCDGSEQCLSYNCVPGISPCDDGNICTEDICHEGNETCVNNPIPGCCNTDSDCDNAICPGLEICSDNVCIPGSKPCDDDNICTLDSCNEDLGCINTPIENCCFSDEDCNNDIFCDGEEICLENVCIKGSPPSCDDNDECTDDSCDVDSDSCVSVDNGECCIHDAGCQNGIFCDGEELCRGGKCISGEPISCDDSNLCTIDTCDEETKSCNFTPLEVCCETNADCDNGIFCDGEEVCSEGQCLPPQSERCFDNDVCTNDICSEGIDECFYLPIVDCCYVDKDCDDGDVCTTDICDNNVCYNLSNGDCIPSAAPSWQPSTTPSNQPSTTPSILPSTEVSLTPTTSDQPSSAPSTLPTYLASTSPTTSTSDLPSSASSFGPSKLNSLSPTTTITTQPSNIPSILPSHFESISPTFSPSDHPSSINSASPSNFSDQPSKTKSYLPSLLPSFSPTNGNSDLPSIASSYRPTNLISNIPTKNTSEMPSISPSTLASINPTISIVPSHLPSNSISNIPTINTSVIPSISPSTVDSKVPSNLPSNLISNNPTINTSEIPSISPSILASIDPTISIVPSNLPSKFISNIPTIKTSEIPSISPSTLASTDPTKNIVPSNLPSIFISNNPTINTSEKPSLSPSTLASTNPTPSNLITSNHNHPLLILANHQF